MTLKWNTIMVLAFTMGLGLFSLGCELDECTDDPETEVDECADIFSVLNPGQGLEEEEEEELDPDEEIGCEVDGFCNSICATVNGTPTDDDCNPNVPGIATSGSQSDSCDCDWWGFVCEAANKCDSTVCECDPDCNHPDMTMVACGIDNHCDTYCPTDLDSNCLNEPEKNGKYCGGGGGEGGSGEEGGQESCDMEPDNCDAVPGTADPCPEDDYCDDFDLACEGDDWCDDKCAAGADPDC